MIVVLIEQQCYIYVQALLEATALPSVFTLGKEPFALGKGFAECSTRQSPLGKIFLGKGSLPSAFQRGTRQNKKKLPSAWGGTRQNIFSRCAPAVNGYFAECPTQHSVIFLKKLLCRVPQPRHSAKFFLFFLKKYFAECPCLGTRQSFFKKKYFAECPCAGTRQSFFYFVLKLLCRVPLPGSRQSFFYFF